MTRAIVAAWPHFSETRPRHRIFYPARISQKCIRLRGICDRDRYAELGKSV